MKKMLLFFVLTLALTFVGCGSGGGGSSPSDTNSDGSVTKTLSSENSSTKVEVKGEDGETLTLDIPALPLGSEDMQVNFKLSYVNGLPTLVVKRVNDDIDDDIEFVTAVSFSLKSSALKDGEFALVYVSKDGTEYPVAYTQNGDTITATLTHFSQYQIVPAPSQPAAEDDVGAYLTSWEANNKSKTMEDVGMLSINTLYAKIQNIQDAAKKAAFLKRYESALLVLASNSLNEWRSLKIEYFSKYCMTQAFKDTIAYYATLYNLFENFGASNDEAFDMLQTELVTLTNQHYEASYSAWKILFLPPCDAIDTPSFVKCAEEYEDFILKALISYFDGKTRFNNDIMGNVESKIVDAANDSMSNPDGCDCLVIQKSILTQYFSSHQANLLKTIEAYMSENCEESINTCPLLWNIAYSHNYTSSESGDPVPSVANATFTNVLIYPRGDYYDNTMTLKEEQACSAYMDDNGHATQTQAKTYKWTEDGIEIDDGAPSFGYACTKSSSCNFRDSETDTAFKDLDAGYISGESLDAEWQPYGYPRVYLTIEEDIFEEIYKGVAFSINDSRAQMSFTPVPTN